MYCGRAGGDQHVLFELLVESLLRLLGLLKEDSADLETLLLVHEYAPSVDLMMADALLGLGPSEHLGVFL